jgi:hypothetical protein
LPRRPGKLQARSTTGNKAEETDDAREIQSASIFGLEHDIPLVNVVIVLAVAGILLWLVNRYIPMQGTIKGILNGVVVIVVAVWLLRVFGLLNTISQFRAGH